MTGTWRRAWACAGAAAVLGVAGIAQQPAEGGFEAILWLNAEHARTAKALAAVRALGFTGVTISADEDPSIPGAHGLRFYRDQVAGKGVLELRDPEWAERQRAYERSRSSADLVRPQCLSDPAVLSRLRDVVTRRLGAALPHAPFACTLGDEVAMTRHANPLDFCTSSHCTAAFREFLRARHRTIDRLNAAWGTRYGDWDEVMPFTADRIRARELQGQAIPANLRPWSEHLEFCDRVFARAVASATRTVDSMAQGLRRGLTGMQPPSAYGGHDYQRLLAGQSFFEAYDIGAARDLAACLAPRGAWQVVTLFPPDPGQPMSYVRARLFDAIAHGMRGAVVWSSRDVLGSGESTEYARELASSFRRLRGAMDAAAGAAIERSPVWLVESQASVRAHWMLDSIEDGRTWIRRLSSYERTHSTSLAARHGWLRLCEDVGLQPRFVTAEALPAGLAAGGPRLLVLPAQLALSDQVLAAIQEFVRAGGTVVADHGAALYDEHLVRRSPAGLDALFGIRGRGDALQDMLVREGRAPGGVLATGVAAAERGVRGPHAERAGDFWIQAEHQVDAGRAVYWNLAVCDYGRMRLDPARTAAARDLRARLRRVMQTAGVEIPVEVRGQGLPTCIERVRLRAVDGRELLAVRMHALESPALMGVLAKRGPRPVQLEFPEAVVLHDLISDRRIGPARVFEAELAPWVGLLYAVERDR